MPLQLPFSAHSNSRAEAKGSKVHGDHIEASLFADFNAKRNSGRIERYFIKMRHSVMLYAISIVSFIIFIALANVRAALSEQIYVKFFYRAGAIMYSSTTSKVYKQITDAFFEASYFSQLVANFLSAPRIAPLNVTGAVNITQMMYDAYSSCSTCVITSYDVGLEDGEAISLQPEKGNIYIKYTNTSTKGGWINPSRKWLANNHGYNPDFPYKNGIDDGVGGYNASARTWYRYAVTMNESAWTNFFIGKGFFDDRIIISSVSPIWENGNVIAVAGMLTEASHIQDIVTSKQPTVNSRIAITRDDGTLLAVTGTESATDLYKGDIIVKTIYQISDPVWKAVTASSDFKKGSNLNERFDINGQLLNYVVAQTNFSISKDVNYTIQVALCGSDYNFTNELTIRSSISYIVMAAGVFIIILLVLFIFIERKRLYAEQANLLLSTSNNASYHVKQNSIKAATVGIYKLYQTKTDDLDFQNEIIDILKKLYSTANFVYFNTRNIYASIPCDTVRNKLISIYGEPEEIIERPLVAMNQGMNFKSDNEPGSSSAMSSALNESVIRNSPLQNDDKHIRRKVLSHFKNTNIKYEMFNEKYYDVIKVEIDKLNSTSMRLLYDSLDFIHIIMQTKVSDILPESIYFYVLDLSVLSWHISMKNRSKDGIDLVNRYFLSDSNELKLIIKKLLTELYKIKKSNEPKEWDKIMDIAYSIIDCTPIIRQQTAVIIYGMFSSTIDHQTKLSNTEATLVIILLYIASAVSVFFHDPETSKNSQCLIHNNSIDTNKINSFLNCVFTKHIKPIMESLNRLCEPNLMRYFMRSPNNVY